MKNPVIYMPIDRFMASAGVLVQVEQLVIDVMDLCEHVLKVGSRRDSPGFAMWADNRVWLFRYYTSLIDAWQQHWVDHRYKRTKAVYYHRCLRRDLLLEQHPDLDTGVGDAPVWLGWEPMHESHRADLCMRYGEPFTTYWPDALDEDVKIIWPRLMVDPTPTCRTIEWMHPVSILPNNHGVLANTCS